MYEKFRSNSKLFNEYNSELNEYQTKRMIKPLNNLTNNRIVINHFSLPPSNFTKSKLLKANKNKSKESREKIKPLKSQHTTDQHRDSLKNNVQFNLNSDLAIHKTSNIKTASKMEELKSSKTSNYNNISNQNNKLISTNFSQKNLFNLRPKNLSYIQTNRNSDKSSQVMSSSQKNADSSSNNSNNNNNMQRLISMASNWTYNPKKQTLSPIQMNPVENYFISQSKIRKTHMFLSREGHEESALSRKLAEFNEKSLKINLNDDTSSDKNLRLSKHKKFSLKILPMNRRYDELTISSKDSGSSLESSGILPYNEIDYWIGSNENSNYYKMDEMKSELSKSNLNSRNKTEIYSVLTEPV